MSVIATDVLIKTAIESALADLRKNAWLLDDIFNGLVTDPLALYEYGYKEVEKAKEWFLGNQIEVYFGNRIDNPRFPCITVTLTGSREMQERTSLSDEGSVEDIDPQHRRKQPQKTYPPFTPSKYDPSQGYVTMPVDSDTSDVIPGQYLVSSRSGKAYIINQVIDSTTFSISPGMVDDFTGAYIAPPTTLWNLHRELTFMEETFGIGLHAQSDLAQAIWLRQVVTYILLRYKEAYLEGRGYELSSFSVGAIELNPYFKEVEQVFSCPITLNGQTECSFIKYIAPKLQTVRGGIRIIDGPATPEEYLKYAKAQGWVMENDPK